MTKNIKLTTAQKVIINLLKEGWQVGHYQNSDKVTIQKGGIGRGGEAKRVATTVFRALVDNQLINKTGSKYPVEYYELTEAGKGIESVVKVKAQCPICDTTKVKLIKGSEIGEYYLCQNEKCKEDFQTAEQNKNYTDSRNA